MKITNIALYGGFDATVGDSYKANEHLTSLDIEYSNLFYNDPTQFEHVLGPVNGWFANRTVDSFPFVIWDEVDEDGNIERKIAQGLKEIKAVPFKSPKLKEKS